MKKRAYKPKTCLLCGKTYKPTTGHVKTCGEQCSRKSTAAYQRQHYLDNTERIVEYQRQYHQANKGRIQERKRKQRKAGSKTTSQP